MEISMTVFWLALLVALVLVEIATMGLTTIWFAAGALLAAAVSALGAPLWLQILVFLAGALVLLFFTRPLAVKYFNKDRVRTNAESLIGRQAIVISEIDNLQGIGQVNVGGQEWSAKSIREEETYKVGTVVKVVAISGVKLVVEERKED